ncbi:MAG TPA: hypothetical protein VG713_08845 [Pirellulales bacterium]|nr:hypothetical protein [Pirellulales bacterium]
MIRKANKTDRRASATSAAKRPAGRHRGADDADEQICLTDDCGHKASARGLCPSCYQCAVKLVAAGKVSWQQLEDMGLARPAVRVRGPFRQALQAAMDVLQTDVRRELVRK